jgi:hypothetical protein
MFQEISNGVLKTQFGACLPFQPRFWTFITVARVQLPKWNCTWESLGSIPHTIPPLWKCVSHLNTFSWPHGPLHSTFSHKPNVKVVTLNQVPKPTYIMVAILEFNCEYCINVIKCDSKGPRHCSYMVLKDLDIVLEGLPH